MKIVCIGRNYAEHAKELGNEIPGEPVIFMKPENALLQDHNAFYYPDFTKNLHYECELVLRISKGGKNIPASLASQYYDAISVGIDFTARDVQDEMKKKGLPWEKAKAFDNSAVVGTFINMEHWINAKSLLFSLKKNGEEVQKGDSDNMLFDFDSIIEHITRYFYLNEGDLIYTGTPEGVGSCVAGDELEGFFGNDPSFKVQIR